MNFHLLLVPFALFESVSGQYMVLPGVGAGLCADTNGNSYDTIVFTGDVASTWASCANQCVQLAGPNEERAYSMTSWQPGAYECRCHFDDGIISSVNDVSPVGDRFDSGSGGTGAPTQVTTLASANCIKLQNHPSLGCDAKILAAVDRTYRRNVVNTAIEIESALSESNDALEYNDLTFGLVAVLQHQVKWLLRMDDPDAQDQTEVGTMISTSIVGGWKHRASNFWPIFTNRYGNMVVDPDMPGFILLFTDGQLHRRGHWRRFQKRKAKMAIALGAQMPQIICWRVGTTKTSKFLDAVCDELVYDGMDSKTIAQVAADVKDIICPST